MILSIIQARMGSSRLPGKVMMKVGHLPLIGYMLKRLSYSEKVDKFIVATTDKTSDDELANYVENLGYEVFRGSEENVLERFTLAAKPYKPEAVLRLTGDCVLADPTIIDNLIALFRKSKADYCWVDSSFAEGLDAEILSYSTLKTVFLKAKLASEHEHITQFIHNNSDNFSRVPLKNKIDESKYRIVVDEPEDLEVVRNIVEHFEAEEFGINYSFREIKDFLNRRPEILALNRHIVRNEGLKISLENDKNVR